MKMLEKLPYDKIIISLGAIGVLYYITFRIFPKPKPEHIWGDGSPVNDTFVSMADILQMVMRECWSDHTVLSFFKDNENLIQSDQDINDLANAFGVRPYDWCLFELNLPDFIYPDLNIFQWIWKSTDKNQRAEINSHFTSLGITYRL